MTSRRKFRDELHNLPPEFDLGASSAELMRRGRRIRTTRQGAVIGAVALVVAGIGTTAAQLGNHTSAHSIAAADKPAVAFPPAARYGPYGPDVAIPPAAAPVSSGPAPVTSTPPAGASALPAPVSPVATTSAATSAPLTSTSASAACSPAAQSTVGAPPASDGANAVPWGALIKVGPDASGKAVVIYGFHIENSQVPCDKVGFMLGTATAAGQVAAVTGEVAANETSGSDLAPGFHATSESGGGNQISNWYIFGYYVGDATSISIPEKESALPASAATVVPWSVNPDVKIWWIGGSGAVPNVGVPTATDAQGNVLPAGNASTPAVG
jgi:hypothetical protein